MTSRNKYYNLQGNRLYTYCAIMLSILSWFIFKIYYPYPNLTFDSYYYIEAAASNSAVSTWPIGYSKFIQLIGFFTHSGNVLVTAQFVILQISFLFLFTTIHRLFHLKKWICISVFIFLFLNPLFLFASNHVMSDILFTGLSILWITQLIWIVFKPKPYMAFTHAILLFIIFTIRYSALYYPIIATIIILISSQSLRFRLFSIGLMILLLFGFIQFTSYKMGIVTGSRQFSYTGGWKQANNALYMYEHTYMLNTQPVPGRFKTIDSITKSYFKAPHAEVDLLDHMDVTKGTWYTSFDPSPLRQYMKASKGIDPGTSDFKKLAYFGPFYNDYGIYLIKRYPLAFAKYVIFPNIITYTFPILEIYDTDNLAFSIMNSEFGLIAQKWFNLKDISVSPKLIQVRALLLSPFSAIFTIVHLLFLFTFISFLWLKAYNKVARHYNITIIIITSFCLVNFLFIILVAPSVLRFQLTVFVLEFINILLIVNNILRLEDTSKSNHIDETFH